LEQSRWHFSIATTKLIEGVQYYCGHGSNSERQHAKQDKRQELFTTDAWFGSVVAINQIKAIILQDEDQSPVGHDWVAQVKTNHKLYLIRDLTNTAMEEEWAK
jgi:hypothetical protein